MAITVVINPPLPTDNPATFNSKAFSAWAALAALVPELNSLITEFNGYANTATTKANEAAASASAANTSKNAAASSATSASGSATTATTKASEAASSASAASTSASTASQKASDAAASAGTATTKASEAASSAATASSAVTTATNKANEAAGSATAAAGHATTATTKAADAVSAAGTATTKAGEATSAATTATSKAAEATSAAGSVTAAASTATTKANEAAASAVAAAQSAQDAANAAAGEPTITKAQGYLTWTGSTWAWKNETYLLASQKGASNGLASLDANGKIPESQLPAIAIVDSFPVASQSAMLGLTAQKGDVAIRSDLNKTFILQAEPASMLGNWLEMKTPTDAVTSVAGRTGVITLNIADINSLQATLDGKQASSTNLNGWSSKAVPSGVIVDASTAQTISSKTLNNTTLSGSLKFAAAQTATSSSSVAVNFSTNSIWRVTLTGNTTATLTLPGPGRYTLVLAQDSTGGRTFTFSNPVVPMGSATLPALNTAANGLSVLTVFYDGTTIFVAVGKGGAS